jgi:hypothetical protein
MTPQGFFWVLQNASASCTVGTQLADVTPDSGPGGDAPARRSLGDIDLEKRIRSIRQPQLSMVDPTGFYKAIIVVDNYIGASFSN